MSTTVNRGYTTPATGSLVDTWGSAAMNPNFAAIDTNIGGIASIALTNIDVTLNSSQYACGTIVLTGTLTGPVNVIFPSVQGWWSVDNQTTGAFTISLNSGAGNVIGVPPGEEIDIQVNGTSGLKYRNLGRIGSYIDYAGAAVPAWVTACTVPPYLPCDGTTFSAVTYPALNTILGTTTLPDLRGRSRFYLNGGTGRITTAGSGIDGDTRFSAGGAQTVTLDTTMIPAHTHTATSVSAVTDPGHNHTAGAGGGGGNLQNGGTILADTGAGHTATNTTGITVATTTSNANTGGGLAHQNMPPAAIAGITMIRAA